MGNEMGRTLPSPRWIAVSPPTTPAGSLSITMATTG